jgi:hypothetical protein
MSGNLIEPDPRFFFVGLGRFYHNRGGPWGEVLTAADMEKSGWLKPRLGATIEPGVQRRESCAFDSRG